MVSFAGLRGTGDWGADERPKNFREMILWANPNGTSPLFALMARMKKESVNDPEFAWWEERLDIIRLTTTADLSATSTAATVSSGALALVPGDLLLVEKTEPATYDNEIVEVSSVTSDTAFVVKRAVAGTSGAGAATGANMTFIGNAFEEGTRSPNVTNRNPTKIKNYVQIFKTKVELTETARLTKARTGDPWANDKKRRGFDHSMGIEMALMFGRPHEVASGPTKGKPVRYTGGLSHFITTNRKIYTTTPTEDSFLDFATPLFDFDAGGAGDERLMLCGNGFWNALNKLARNSSSTRINYDGIVNFYGMRLSRWVIPQGTLFVKTHPLMNRHGRFKNAAFVLNPAGLIWRPMRDTKFMDNIQENDEDTRAGQWLTEAGLEIHFEYTMGYLGNFTVP